MKDISLKLIFLLVIIAFTAALIACDSMPAAKMDPNGPGGDDDVESSSDGDVDGDGEGSEADGDENDISQLPLDEILDASHARAGIVTNPDDELIPGEKAQGTAGDFKIYNNHAAYIIQGGDHTNGWRGVSGSGGTILDAAALDESGVAADDRLIELWPAIEMDVINQGDNGLAFGTYRNFKVEKVELINNGSNGKAAIVKATGVDWGSPLADRHSKLLSAPPNPQVKLFIYYTLDPDSDYLRIEIRAKQFTEESTLVEVVTLGAGILTDSRQETYYFGYRPEKEEPAYLEAYSVPALARYSNGASYLLSCGDDEKLQLMKFDERPYYATCAEQLKVEKGGTVINELRFYASTESPDALLKSIYKPEETQTRAKGTLSVPDSLSIDEIIVAAKDFETDRLLSVSFPYKTDDQYFYDFFILPDAQNLYIVAYSKAGGEGIPTPAINLLENGHVDNVQVISPASPAEVSVSVSKATQDGDIDIPARIDFYIQSEYDARKKPYFTAFIGDDQPERIPLPMYGLESQIFTIVASAGLFHTIDVKTNQTLVTNPAEGEEQTLEFSIKQSVDLGTVENLPPDGDIDASENDQEYEIESELENTGETEALEDAEADESTKSLKDVSTTLYIPMAVGLVSDTSLDNFTPLDESLKAARAAGYRSVSYADACTITYAEDAIDGLGYSESLTAVSAMNVKTPQLDDYSQSGYTTGAIGITAPEDAEQYFDIPGFYYSDYDGGFNGVSPPPGAWDAFRSDYSAVLIHQPLLRGNGDSSGLLERFGIDGTDYDPYVGKDSLDSLVGDYLAQWNSVSLLSASNDFIYLYNTLADWASLLNQGYACTATFGNDGTDLSGMGYPANLIVLEDNTWDGASGAVSAALKKHRNIVVAGPTVKINITDALPGDTYTPDDITSDGASITLHLQVTAPTWVPFNFAMVVQNGVVVWPQHNTDLSSYIQTFEDEGYRMLEKDVSIPMPLDISETPEGKYKDFWISVIAFAFPNVQEMYSSANGENLRDTAASYTLFPVYPEAISFGLSNPIWVDANGNDEFEAPGVLPEETPYLQNSELCALLIAHDNEDLLGLRESCCEKYPTSNYCNN